MTPHDRSEPHEVLIRGEMIRLGQLLKLTGVIDDGGVAKAFLGIEQVSVNGERETRRGRQLRAGDTVAVAGRELHVIVRTG
ncbi:MAG: RNA-binding S4 domain-containing protein [Thermoleophilaceae bacterium]|jgi:ribosome-associated protein